MQMKRSGRFIDSKRGGRSDPRPFPLVFCREGVKGMLCDSAAPRDVVQSEIKARGIVVQTLLEITGPLHASEPTAFAGRAADELPVGHSHCRKAFVSLE